MAAFPLPLNPNETVLKTAEHVARVKNSPLGIGYNLASGTLWLTDQRLVYQPVLLGGPLDYPLRRITRAEQAAVTISKGRAEYGSYGSYDSALHVAFENGGKEYFIPQDIPSWSAAIMAALPGAPDLPFTQVPPSRSAVEEGSRGLWVMLGIMAGIFVLFLCSVAACFILPLLLSLPAR